MKIAVMLVRPWSAIHRLRSFLINVQKLGHELSCIGPRAYAPNAYDLTRLALTDLGLDLLPVSNQGPYIVDQYDVSAIQPTLNRLNPDVVLSDCFGAPFEWAAQDWAYEHHKLGLVLDPFLALHGSADLIKAKLRVPDSIILVSNVARYNEWTNGGFKAVIVGYPELDLIQDNYDIVAIREKLGTQKDQPLIAFFDAFADYRADPALIPDNEAEIMARTLLFLEYARKQDWKVIVHLHPGERAWINSSGPEGLTFTWRYPFLKAIQDLGGAFIDDVASGQIGELIFQKRDSLELLAAADCIVGTAPEVSDKVYVMEKWSISLLSLPEHYRTLKWPNLMVDSTPNFQVVSKALEGPGFKSDKAFIRQWFSVLDRQCWRRVLNICEGHS